MKLVLTFSFQNEIAANNFFDFLILIHFSNTINDKLVKSIKLDNGIQKGSATNRPPTKMHQSVKKIREWPKSFGNSAKIPFNFTIKSLMALLALVSK